MIRLACPTCTYSTTARAEGARIECPSCGCALSRVPGPRGWSPDIGDEQLAADVREAFGSSTQGLGEPGSTWLDPTRSRRSPFERAKWGAALPAGRHLDDFEILEEVGRGGMGIVYRARQVSLNREVALKVLPSALHRSGVALRRFKTEAQAVARLKHANVVPIYAQGEHEGHLYYAMELIDGVSLDVAIRSRPEMLSSTFWHTQSAASSSGESGFLTESDSTVRVTTDVEDARPPATVSVPRSLEDFRLLARMVAGVAEGLAHAADQGVIHRDIKPHNLLLATDGLLHITDFGLAQLTDEPRLTMTGEVMGTAAYISPEQIRGGLDVVDHRTDVYSLGATLYELLTHRRPFDGDSRDQVLSKICNVEPLRPRRLDSRIPRDLETICLRAMEKDSARRCPSAAAMAEDLRRFTNDQPILSRPVGPMERAFKWARRRKAATVAMAATAIALVLAAWVFQSVATTRQAEATDLLQTAYDRLAYVDYRNPELVIDDIERAVELGSDSHQLDLTWALADLGFLEDLSAIAHLQDILDDTPNDARALYMLAWAQWRTGDHGASLETFEDAEELGGPASPDAWFFRGLAAHFDKPRVAVESYREANSLRADDNEFYPQAILHLARAHNQEMYVTRNIDTFAESEAGLGQLIEHGHYGAYPYYLLSIAHRLAAESLELDPDSESADEVSHHFAEALRWARKGQLEDPSDDRPITAEAECLGSMERFEEAIEARTRAISVADRSREQWEGRHYRWRLYYWTGRYAAALADLEACESFSPDSKFYSHVYPALVYAEMGEFEQALELTRELATANPTDVQAVLWSATSLRLLGQADVADALLRANSDTVDYTAGLVSPQSEEWVEALYAYCLEETDFDELLELAADATSPRKLLGEAHLHAGAMALANGRSERAFEHITEAHRSFDGELAYTFHARTIRERMRSDPGWPLWLATSHTDDESTQD